MHSFDRKTLAVIGAGPKGLAVAVKAKVLEEFGIAVPRIVLIEKNGAGANWTGEFGFTNGEMKLGTSPEKDVVFPIETNIGDASLNDKIQKRLLQFSWISFLVHRGEYSDWVDRGRPAPCHLRWSQYLSWVASQLAPQVFMQKGEVIEIGVTDVQRTWKLKIQSDHGLQYLYADRLMLTGPGLTNADFIQDQVRKCPRGVFDLESFWHAIRKNHFPKQGKIAVVGAGENSASALLALSKYAPNALIEIISPKGFVSTRSENFYENQFYSQPERNRWADLTLEDRQEFIARTDLGVFSVQAMTLLNEEAHHKVVPGRVIGLSSGMDECSAKENTEADLRLKIEYAGKVSERNYNQVILATGFDPLASLRKLLSKDALECIESQMGCEFKKSNVLSLIENDMSLAGVTPALHLPMLSGLNQGPGFANLSCLGRLSDRILSDSLSATVGMRSQKYFPETMRVTLDPLLMEASL